MRLVEALFTGAKAILTGVVEAAAQAIRIVFAEFDRSAVGRATTALIDGVTQKYFSEAKDLAGEEQDLGAKYRRDGTLPEQDIERLAQIHRERDALRSALEETKARQAEEELKSAEGKLISVPLTDDDVSASAGLLATKRCSRCGGTMRIRQGAYNKKTRAFWWQCTAQNSFSCPIAKIDLAFEKSSILRRPDADLDGSDEFRRKVWTQPTMITKTHTRLRESLGDDDEQMICPLHVLPMKLLQRIGSSGLMLDSYEYICLGVTTDGRGCRHKVEVKSFPQVSAVLRRRDGIGIIDS